MNPDLIKHIDDILNETQAEIDLATIRNKDHIIDGLKRKIERLENELKQLTKDKTC